MVKKTLLSLAVATALVSMTGCNVSTTDKYDDKIVNNNPGQAVMPSPTANTYPVFDPANSQIPLANDIVFAKAEATDGTAWSDLTPSKTSPVTTALQQLAGFSTIAPLYIEFVSKGDQLDADTPVPPGTVWLINAKTGTPFLLDDTNPMLGLGYETRFVQYNEQNNEDGKPVKPYAAKYALQILPKKPLDPGTQYLVVLTDGIVDKAGDPIGHSSMHALLSDTSDGVVYPSGSLIPAAGVVQQWNQVAAGALAGLAASPLASFFPALTGAKSVLAYTFRTDDGMSQMRDYAAPVIFFKKKQDQAVENKDIETATALGQLVGALENPTVPAAQETVKQVMGGLEAPRARDVALIPIVAIDDLFNEKVAQTTAQGMAAADPTGNTKVEDIIDTVLQSVKAQNPGASPSTILAQGNPESPFVGDTFTRFIQGQIALPNFLPAAEMTSLSGDVEANITKAMIDDKLWTANDALASLGIAPPKDADGSTNVTFHFPFPKSVGVNTAPLLITMPDKDECTNLGFDLTQGHPVVIYVHGITGSRGNMLPYASALADKCIATVGIDLPLHGVAPQTTNSNNEIVANALTLFNVEPGQAALTGSPWGGVAAQFEVDGEKPFAELAERHNNTYQTAATAPVPMARQSIQFGEKAVGDSGSAFINLQNFGRTRDNLRQSVTDLLNLNASLGNISDALVAQGKTKLDTDKVFVVGHSLGSLVASTFVAVNNDAAVQAGNPALNKIRGAILANSGAHITKFLENSPNFAPVILGGLAKSGVMQGTEDFEKFIYIMQSTIDAVDPANAVAGLKDIPVLQFSMTGSDLLPTLGTDVWKALSLPDYLKATPAMGGVVDGNYVPDNVVPTTSYFGGNAASNPFAGMSQITLADGTKPFALLTQQPTAYAPMVGSQGLENLFTNSGKVDYIPVSLTSGTHSTFGNADDPATFQNMVGQSVNFILTK